MCIWKEEKRTERGVDGAKEQSELKKRAMKKRTEEERNVQEKESLTQKHIHPCWLHTYVCPQASTAYRIRWIGTW